ncbi:T3SS effector HopA1 family protein [Pseudanabaena sp. PCC 6802]|uniref:T3SS effector HopA1 family protein n=1 Tax=Pseudanabaena sp. PCC 6802 TaxID=118173 RepID=UPI000344E76B|nr:T3SS effector HopA1 family protein [Pseudanabaena sp. PCC 6802]
MTLLLNSLKKPTSDFAQEKLFDALEDIVNRIEIKPDLSIHHPDYKPLELSEEAIASIRAVSPDLLDKYLSSQLQSFLYGIYYNGHSRTVLAPETEMPDIWLHKHQKNNTYLGVDLEFFSRLHASNKGKGYFDPGWQVVGQESDGSLFVKKNGLTLYIEPTGANAEPKFYRLPTTEQSTALGDIVAIRMPRNLVQNGFYMAASDRGVNTYPQTVRVYFNVTDEGAIAMMQSLTQQLNAIDISFTFKVLYNPFDYNRCDAGVLYFERSNYPGVCQVLQSVYNEHRIYFKDDIPLFTKFLAPGLALAEEPDRKFADKESFGLNRCQIVANGLIEARANGDESPNARLEAIYQQFSQLGIDLHRPYLNPSSEDIYTPLEVD